MAFFNVKVCFSVLFERNHGYVGFIVLPFTKLNHSIAHCEEGMVFPDAHAFGGMVTGAALADNDITGNGDLATEDLNAESFAVRFASVLGTTDAFLVCHGELVLMGAY